jgi:hypothetical protein
MSLQALQQQRSQILAEIQRRGGAAKAPNFARQLSDIEGQIRVARGGQQQPGAAPRPTTGGPMTVDQGATAGPVEDRAGLQAERTRYLNEIQRRGGAANAPGFARKLSDVEGRLRAGRRTGGPQPGGVGASPSGDLPIPGGPGGNYQPPGEGPLPQGPVGLPPAGSPPPMAPPPQKAPPLYVDQGGGFKPRGYQAEPSPDSPQFAGGEDPFSPQAAGPIAASSQNADLATRSRQFAGRMLDDPSQLTKRALSGDVLADRQRIEDQTYSSLTKDVDQSEKSALNQKEQELHNKGIQFNADPNSRYQQELKAIRTAFAGSRMDARTQAIQLGGQEYQRSFDIGEQSVANRLNELNTFSNLGEAGRQFDVATGEGSRQFDNTLGNERSQFNRNYNRQNFESDREYGQRNFEFRNTLGEQGRQYDNTLGQRESEYGRSLSEGQRQFNANFGEGQRQYDGNFGQRNREFDANFGEGQRQFNADLDYQNRALGEQGRLTDAEREQQKMLKLKELEQAGKISKRQLQIEQQKIRAAMAAARGGGSSEPEEEDIFE